MHFASPNCYGLNDDKFPIPYALPFLSLRSL
jgi:hypothetical protein